MRCCLLLLPLLLGACSAPAPTPAAKTKLHYGQVAFHPCALSSLRDSVEAQCASVSVPEDYDAPKSRTIELAVAWIPAGGEPEADPMMFLAGGPGQSALQSYPMLHDALADARRNRHVLLVDARGTGGSHPLRCVDAQGHSAVADELDGTPAALRGFAERCLAQLEPDSDVRHYTTADHVRDLDTVRERVGVSQLNLVGVSYGTRVAQQYAKRYPQHTRTVTLDSVVPPALVLSQEMASNLEDALTRQFARCRADAACAQNLGDPAENLRTVRARLQQGGLAPVRYRDPTDGAWREEAPRFGHLAALLRLYAYQPHVASALPLLLHEAEQGRYEALLAQSRLLVGDVSESIWHGMQLSVICGEDAAELHIDPANEGSVLGNELIALSQAQCSVWPSKARPADFRAALTGEVALLALSGEFDPVTPPRYGEEVVKTLPNGRHLELPGQGHSVLGVGCVPKLFAQFVETADAAALDASCLERMSATPPFAGAYGWEP